VVLLSLKGKPFHDLDHPHWCTEKVTGGGYEGKSSAAGYWEAHGKTKEGPSSFVSGGEEDLLYPCVAWAPLLLRSHS
jgi:hypothetical protein